MHGRAIDIIKRSGQRPTEPEGVAENTANTVCEAVIAWLATKPEVTSADLRRKATDTLEHYHPEAAYLYKHHRLVI